MNIGSSTSIQEMDDVVAYTLEFWKFHLQARYRNAYLKGDAVFIGKPVLVMINFTVNRTEIWMPTLRTTTEQKIVLTYQFFQSVSPIYEPMATLMDAVQRATAIRQCTFRECYLCGQLTPPEVLGCWRNEPVCQSCVTKLTGYADSFYLVGSLGI